MILLYTTGWRRYHRRDLLNICCYDLGEHVRFGFRGALVDERLKRKSGKDIQGDALVVYAQYVPADSGDPNEFAYEFHAIREVTIVDSAEDSAGSYYVDLRLDKFVRYPGNVRDGQHDFQDFITTFKARPLFGPERQSAGSGATLENKFVVKIDDVPPTVATDDWIELIRRVRSGTGLSDCIFFRQIQDGISQGQAILPSMSQGSIKKGPPQISVVGGSSRGLGLQVFFGDDTPVKRPLVTLSGVGVGEVHGPFVRQDSEAYLFEYLVDFREGFRLSRGMLTLSADPSAVDEGAESVYGPERNAIISVTPQKLIVWSALFLIIIGSALPDLVDGSEMKVVGAAMFSLGVLIAFRKLPWSGV